MLKYEKSELDPIIGTQYLSARFKYRDKETGKLVAFKRLNLTAEEQHSDPNDNEIGIPLAVIREFSLHKLLEHENIARLEDIEYDPGDSIVCLVLEYPGVDMRKFLLTEPAKASDQGLIKKLLYQLLCGISYYHSMKVAHGNLNHKNVLIDCTNNNLKIINLLLDITGHVTYKAPELFLGSLELTIAADMFAIGCIFAEMMTREPLFSHQGEEIKSIFELVGTPTEENWPGASELYPQLSQYDKIEPKDLSVKFPSLEEDGIELISKLLCLDPSKRITADDALKHNYFKDVKH